ncbi:hypothetical protein LTR08_005579 [Meristemomyces frigidus]|nr:hypothetical protein LTR08_005579 [Meristemomyces frigidus]
MSSDDTVPSSPAPADDATFSDEPTRVSSPPSSPPGFPWEQQQEPGTPTRKLSKPPKTAFSILGKRKALSPIANNARPTKKPATATATAKGDAKSLTQMQISLGQEVQKRCKTCGMEYVASSAEDRKLHDKYHRQNTEGYDVGKDFVQKAREGTASEGARDGDSVCAVDCRDKPARRRKAQAVLEIVQRELGAVPIPEKQVWHREDGEGSIEEEPKFRAYMYIRGTKCIGFMLTEMITEAHRVVEPATVPKRAPSGGEGGRTALAALRARKLALEEAAAQAAKQPIQVCNQSFPARTGISRIWTSPNHRQQNIATMLLDTALSQDTQRVKKVGPAETGPGIARDDGSLSVAAKGVIEGRPEYQRDFLSGKECVAFSQPTEAGARLARRWFGKLYGWAVYLD